MGDRVFGADEKAKLIQIVNEGVTVLTEVQDLQEGLRDTVKAVAEELDIKPSLINKAIKIAQKGEWHKAVDEFDDLETIMVTTGKDKL
jgi:transposase-like protein